MIIKTAIGDCTLAAKGVCWDGVHHQVFYVADNPALVDHFTAKHNDGQVSQVVWEDAGKAVKEIEQAAVLLMESFL